MTDPSIIITADNEGLHNRALKRAQQRLKEGKAYKDLSTVMVVPTRGTIPVRAVESWLALMPPMNVRGFYRLFVSGMEVGEAYNVAIDTILANPQLRDFKYVLTLEEDNLPPPDGLLKLYESICDCRTPCTDHFVQVAGLYWTKGEMGQPMIYGDAKGILSFEPQIPKANMIQECNGTGMGFTLFHMGLFKDKNVPKPWFVTKNEWDPQTGTQVGTQDLYFMANIRKRGYRIASDNRVRVGHLDPETGVVW